MVGCSVSTDRALPAWQAAPVPVDAESCTDGASRQCRLTLSVYSSVATCYAGEQGCQGGKWGPCVNGTVSRKQLPAEGQSWTLEPGLGLQSLSSPTTCTSNPCDPTCQVFDEIPPDPITASGVASSPDWQTGTLTDLANSNIPAGFIDKGINEPCASSDDCQFDQYCQSPSTSATCAHSKCSTGVALSATCDTCVAQVCAADPTCCAAAGATTCTHNKCDTGAILDPTCDGCVAQICSLHPECCSLGGAHDVCATGSKLPTTDNSCAASVCAADPTCCTNTACEHDPCSTGNPLDASCSPAVGTVCQSMTHCSSGGCSHDPCTVNSTAKLPRTSCTSSAWASEVTSACDRNPTCCIATGCSRDPCSTSATSRMVPGACTSDPYLTAVQRTCTSNPSCCTTGCSHDPFSIGTRLLGGCDSSPGPNLVAQVCQSRASCCSASGTWDATCVTSYASLALGAPASGCSHDPLSTGAHLVRGCDANPGPDAVGRVCDARSSCCSWSRNDNNWTSTCVDLYLDEVLGVRSTSCSRHEPWETGQALTAGCDSSPGPNLVSQVCQIRPTCCSGSGNAWDTTCVGLYQALGFGARRFQSGWTADCATLYLEKLSARIGRTVSTCETGYSQNCVNNFTAANGASACNGWDDACITAYAGANGGSCQTSWSQSCVNRVASSCNLDCSQRTWTSACAQAVESVCHQTCPKWSESCVDRVASACGSFCPGTGSCEHDRCLTGGPLTQSCDSCVSQICDLDPACCSSEWDAYCVVKVGSVCGINCQADGGQCVPWLPNQKNPSCGGVDLTVGVPCGDTVPVCNRGQTTAPANASIYTFPANSPQMQDPVCRPDLTKNSIETCNIPVPIPPGQCVDVTCPGVFTNLREIMVNPANAPGAIAECACDNNWSVYKKDNQGLACTHPDCAAATSEATVAKVNMLFMYDRSLSMCEPTLFNCNNPGPTTRWALTTSAFKTFIRDASSAGLRVALRFFPDTVTDTSGSHDCSASNCNTFDQCAVPQVGLGELAAATDTSNPPNCNNSNDPQECWLTTAVNGKYPNPTSTPTRIALGGAYQYMSNYAAAHPYERSFVVLVTDGEPNDCSANYSTVLPQMAEDAYRDYGVVTFTIGIDNQGGTTLLQHIASRGGGRAFMVSATSNGTSTEFLDALNTIRTQAASCELVIDQTNPIDPANVKLGYSPNGTGTPQELTRVTDASACGSGWYFDDPAAPTKVTLCPTTCSTVRSDVAAKLTLALGCPPSYEEQVYSQAYTATCPRGQRPQWGYLSYHASTPGTSTILFQVTTASDAALFTEPPSTAVTDVAVAHGAVGTYTTDTEVCDQNSTGDCPVALFPLLGTPAAFDSALELRVTLRPAATASPQLTDWNLTYSCLDSM